MNPILVAIAVIIMMIVISGGISYLLMIWYESREYKKMISKKPRSASVDF